MLEKVKTGGVEMLVALKLKDIGIFAAFTCRSGGVSKDPFEGLNLSYNVGDERISVNRNRNILGETVGTPPCDWVVGRQVHGARVIQVGELERGRGGMDHMSGMPRTDGILTKTEGMTMAVLVADCIPLVLVADGAVCVSHAGWRGLLEGVPGISVRKLIAMSDTPPGRVLALIGPHIGKCCMEVERAISEEYRRRFGPETVLEPAVGPPRLDMTSACMVQLKKEGLSSNNIFAADTCTFCDDGYFSFRRSSGVTGRQTGLVAIMAGAR